MYQEFYKHLRNMLEQIQEAGTYKQEKVIASPQDTEITLEDGTKVLNFCSNNYLGLSNNSQLVEDAKKYLDQYGYGLSSVRYICGTQTIHRELEKRLAEFVGKEDAILYPSCSAANCGLFETLFLTNDAIVHDQFDNAGVVDGIRLAKAKRFRYKNDDMTDLEIKLQEADEANARFKVIATDGVFSMDGLIANLSEICDLADSYNAVVMVDDSQGIGAVGAKGRGSAEYCGVLDRIDILTGTLGKSLGGATGGFIAAKQEVIDMLRQRSRPYLFSNSVPPVVVATTLKVLEMMETSSDLMAKLQENKEYFRDKMEEKGFDLLPGDHPIIPVMFYDERKTVDIADRLLQKGIYVTAIAHPEVPKSMARLRVQVSAVHTKEQLDKAVAAFVEVTAG